MSIVISKENKNMTKQYIMGVVIVILKITMVTIIIVCK